VTDDLASKLEALAKVATPGPWEVKEGADGFRLRIPRELRHNDEADMRLLAELVNNLDEIVAALRILETARLAAKHSGRRTVTITVTLSDKPTGGTDA